MGSLPYVVFLLFLSLKMSFLKKKKKKVLSHAVINRNRTVAHHFLLHFNVSLSDYQLFQSKIVCILDFPIIDFKGKKSFVSFLLFSFCYLCRGKADDELIFLIYYDLGDTEHVPHKFPHWLCADIGVPQPEHFIISWKGDGTVTHFLRDTGGHSLKSLSLTQWYPYLSSNSKSQSVSSRMQSDWLAKRLAFFGICFFLSRLFCYNCIYTYKCEFS